jgi:acyl transferase domain-containing protein
MDTACSSSGYALDAAYKNIQDGTCDAALVGGVHLVLNIATTTDYNKYVTNLDSSLMA